MTNREKELRPQTDLGGGQHKAKICFVSLQAYPILANKNLGYVGGAELRLSRLGRALSLRGYDVTFVTYGDGGEAEEIIDKIRVIKVYRRSDIARLTTLQKSWQIWRALDKADAGIYFQSPPMPIVVSLFCRFKGKKNFISLSSDMEAARPGLFSTNKIDLKLASKVIVQNGRQQKELMSNFGVRGEIVKNPFDLKRLEPLPKDRRSNLLLWVAEIRPVKQPEIFLELARAIPNANFQMIGGECAGEGEYYSSIKRQAAEIANVEFLGFIPPHEIGSHFRAAALFVNTSSVEGFPNSFLDAWSAGIPVVSLNIDPDEIICSNRLGFHSRSFEKLVADTRTLLESETLRAEMGENGMAYVKKEHDLESIVDQLVAMF